MIYSAQKGTQAANSIVLTADNVNTFAITANSCYVRPLRGLAMNTGIAAVGTLFPVVYDSGTQELVYSTD